MKEFMAEKKVDLFTKLNKITGLIMRRILRNIAKKDIDNMGDISTLADPSVVKSLIDGR